MLIRLGVHILLLYLCSSAFIRGSFASDNSALAKKAQEILKTNCHRCHGQDGSVEGGFNFVLDFKKLVARKKVVAGEPGKSKLMQRVLSADNPMPPEEEKVRPSKEDIAALQAWIAAGASDIDVPPAGRRFLSDFDVLRLVQVDLQQLDERKRRFSRYFAITHLANSGLSEDELQTYRHGLSKLVNSLSWDVDITVPCPVDAGRTIFRIDLRDYRWNASIWRRLLDLYPYGVLHNTPVEKAVREATECELPIVRADWFVFAVSRPPLYHDVLQLPRTDKALEDLLRVEVATNLLEERVARAGFNGSGVSRNNRLIERHKSPYGAYWKSYDFAGNAGRQNLFAHPLGPGTEESQFQHDGGEIIFHLPNGLQGYLLVDGKGNRIDEGPTKIVSVKNKPDPTVINGVSCMSCHAKGMIDKADQIRAHVEKNPAAFPLADLPIIKALYPPEAEFRTLLQKDADRFRKAVTATGRKISDTEPVAALAGKFEQEVDLSTAAAEAGLTPERFLAGVEQAPELARRLGALKVTGGTVQRQVFADLFEEIVRELRLGTSLFTLNKSIAAATETMKTEPKNPNPRFERGNALLDKGDFDKAIADYSEAIRLEFQGAEVFHNRGLAHANRGDYDKAIADYGDALRIDPRRADSLHNRGLAYAQQRAYAAALADLTAALGVEPENAVILSDRGFIHVQKRDYDRAIADYSEALRLQPRSALTLQRRSEAYRLAGATAKAKADSDEAARLQKPGG